MHGDQDFARFFVYLNLFLSSMLLLVLAGNFLVLFVGWELVGLCSYLLIGFWFDRGRGGIGNAVAARKAFIVNRVGDAGFLIAILLLYWNFGSLSFDQVLPMVGRAFEIGAPVVTLISLGLFIGAVGKSAQIPLSVWLPDAMAGPTPVSALIHAATMVTAGVYLITRSYPIFQHAPLTQSIVAFTGSITALYAASVAIAQFDIKRVLAYSTISQLGFMIAAVGLGAYAAGIFHLVTHAFFKALLFLAAGAVVHAMETGKRQAGEQIDPQDMRSMGGLSRRMPLTFMSFTIGALTIAGIPPFSGFFSKDEILMAAWTQNRVIFTLLMTAAFLTAAYMGRQLTMIFLGSARCVDTENVSDSGPLMTFAILALALLSALGGVLNSPGRPLLGHWLGHTVDHSFHLEAEPWIAVLATASAALGLSFGYRVYRRVVWSSTTLDPLVRYTGAGFLALSRGWWIDDYYNNVVVSGFRKLSWSLSRLDRYGFERMDLAVVRYIRRFAELLRRTQTGELNWNLFGIVLGLVITLSLFFSIGLTTLR